MHANWCVLIEISMETGMLNFLLGLLVTARTKETYFSTIAFWNFLSLKEFCVQMKFYPIVIGQNMKIPTIVMKVKKRKLFKFFVCLWYSNRIGSASALSNNKTQKSPRPRAIAPRIRLKCFFFTRWLKCFFKQNEGECYLMTMQTCLDLS